MGFDQQIEDPIDKLYGTLHKKGYYTKSLGEFKAKYNSPEAIDKLYEVVSRDGLYTKTKDDFSKQYFAAIPLKKKVSLGVGGASFQNGSQQSKSLSSGLGGVEADIESVQPSNTAPTSTGAKLIGGKASQIATAIPTKEQTVVNRANKALAKIDGFNGEYEDFRELLNSSPKDFEAIAEQVAPTVNKKEIDAFYNSEESRKDAYINRVLQGYKQQKATVIKENAREMRPQVAERLNAALPQLSELTEKQYAPPQTEEDVKAILRDIDATRQKYKTLKNYSGGSISEMADLVSKLEPLERKLKQVESDIKQSAHFLIGEKVLQRLSQNNPNVTSLEIGKEVMKIIDPQQMEIYELAGGGERSSYSVGGFKETPTKADAMNRTLVEVGNEVKRMYGNETAIQSAEDEETSLKYKYTYAEQGKVKQKIASILFDKGIKPHKATEAQKDEAAKLLPTAEREMWFDLNKPENNTKLPSTGLGYSLRGGYKNTVTDAVKSTFGFLIPNKKREDALDLLEGMSVSDVLGEHPESVARLSQLKQKEKEKTITDAERAEMEDLKTFTDKRSWLQEKVDMMGGGAGQIMGLGSISAFTGGLGNARSAIGAAKALVAPSAGRKGMMAAAYLMSHESNVKEAIRLFPGEKDGLKRFVTTELFTATDMLVERIFPEEKFLQGVLKKDIARLIPNLTAKNITRQLGDETIKNISRTIYRGIKETLKTPLVFPKAMHPKKPDLLFRLFHLILTPAFRNQDVKMGILFGAISSNDKSFESPKTPLHIFLNPSVSITSSLSPCLLAKATFMSY